MNSPILIILPVNPIKKDSRRVVMKRDGWFVLLHVRYSHETGGFAWHSLSHRDRFQSKIRISDSSLSASATLAEDVSHGNG